MPRAQQTPSAPTGGDGRAPGGQGQSISDHDYFTDAVPLRGDRELREREERMRRLERARPRRRLRAPRLRMGVVAAVAVVLLAISAAVLERSTAQNSGDARPPRQPPKAAVSAPVTAAPRIGVAPAVAVVVPRPRPGRHKASQGARPDHARRAAANSDDGAAIAAAMPTTESEVLEPEAAPEPEPETAAEPESEPAPAPSSEPEPSPPGAASKVTGPPSSSEADRQFGFGR